jgi:hypothetical protein
MPFLAQLDLKSNRACIFGHEKLDIWGVKTPQCQKEAPLGWILIQQGLPRRRSAVAGEQAEFALGILREARNAPSRELIQQRN